MFSDILEALGLPYKQVQLYTGDIGFSPARSIHLDIWLPGKATYREISSISNTRDFQARRAKLAKAIPFMESFFRKIPYKDGKKNILAHTLNGSFLAVGRTMVAIMFQELSTQAIAVAKRCFFRE